ncbi:MAG: LD-carboxypeptidase [Saprospiraceae bacterium]
MGSSTFSDFVLADLDFIFNNKTKHTYPTNNTPIISLSKGKAKGKLIGGNLSLLAAMCGTKYLPNAKEKLVYIEDIEEKPYRIDRMLTQLEQAMDLKKAKGIILGQFDGCDSDSDNSLSLRETLDNHFKDIGIPVIYQFPIGHIQDQVMLPIGIEAELDGDKKTLTLLESIYQ